MGIDPHEGTLLTLFITKLARGISGDEALRAVSFKSDEIRDVARALTGDQSVSRAAQDEAERIRSWARLPVRATR